jgi:uncharacterized protein (TIGR03437 family)
MQGFQAFSSTVVLFLALPCHAGFSVQKLIAVPVSDPGQQVAAAAVDSQGNMIVIATATQLAPPGSTTGATPYALVYKLDPNGNQLFSKVLPGAARISLGFYGVEMGMSLAIDGNDDVYIAGVTSSPQSFPFTAVLSSPTSFGFVMKIRGGDGTIAYASQVWIPPSSLTVDGSGQALIAMISSGTSIPVTTGAYASGTGPAIAQTYVGRLSATGDQFTLMARYGGSTGVCSSGIHCFSPPVTTAPVQILLDKQGNIWIAGNTNTIDLPITGNALKSECGCSDSSNDGYLAEFSSDGSQLLYATYFGSSASSLTASDGNNQVNSATIDSNGNIWIVGNTNGSSFPVTKNALQSTLEGNPNGFVSEYSPASNQLLYSSYFGGNSPTGIASGNVLQVEAGPDGTVVFDGMGGSTSLGGTATGFTNGSLFLATIDPKTYVTFVTRLPAGNLGTALIFTPSGSAVVAGTSNVLDIVDVNADSARSNIPSIYGITNSAGGATTGQIAPLELITIYGANIGPATPVTADLSSGAAPTKLGGVQVLLNGAPLSLLYAQSDQINAVAPADISSTFTIVLNNSGTNSNEAVLEYLPASPEAFPGGPSMASAAALNQDSTVNSSANPAQPGTIVSVYGTGFGQFSTNVPVQVYFIGTGIEGIPTVNESLEVTYAGQAPGLVPGVAQINFRLPATLGPYSPQFQFDVGGWLSPIFSLAVAQ